LNLIVGAYSLAFHARPRFTGDLDILIRPTDENGKKLLIANKRAVGRPQDIADLDALAS